MKRLFTLPALILVVMSIVLIGCGGGGGGANPAAPTAEGRLLSLTGKVLLSSTPQAGVSVYLYRADEAEIAGLADQYTARASVRAGLLPDSSTDERITVTDAAGVYRFDGVPEGEYTLMAQKSPTERAALTRLVLSSVNGAVTTKDASLQPTSDITGTISVSGVTDLAGGRVYLLGTSFTSITDATGNFRISYVPTGTGFQLMADFGGAVLSQPLAIEAVTGSTTGSPALSLPLVLTRPSTVAGNILGTATRALFALGDENSHAGTLVYLMQNGLFLNMTETNPAGGYRFFNLPVSPNNVYQVRFAAPSYVPSPAVVDVTVAANTDTVAAPVTLTPKVQTAVLGRLRGRVQKQSFLSVEQETHAIMLRLATGTTPSDHLEFNIRSDDQGYFVFTGIPVGTYALTSADPNYVFSGGPFLPEVLAPVNDLSAAPPFPLVPAATAKRLGNMTGRVVRIQFIDAEASTDLVSLRIATGTPGQPGYFEKITITDPAGNFAFIQVPVGTYSLFCGDPDYIFSPPSPVATAVSAIPSLNNGQYNLVPNPAAAGFGGLVATLSTSIVAPIRVTLVSPSMPGNNRDVYTIPSGAGIHSLFVKSLVPGAYTLRLDPATGYDISPADSAVTITANAITALPANLIPVDIRPTITSVAQSGGSVIVTGANYTSEYQIQLSHIGGDPWFEIPTTFAGSSLTGSTAMIPGGKYNIRILRLGYALLQTTSATVVQVFPPLATSVTATPLARSVQAAWAASPSVMLFEARIALAANPTTPLQVIRATDAVATFSNLNPGTGYQVSVYSLADGLYSASATIAVSTLAIQTTPQNITVTGYASQSSVITPVARNGSIYFVTYPTATLQHLNTITMSSSSIALPSVVSPSLSIGQQIYLTDYAGPNAGLRAYNYDLSGPVYSYQPASIQFMATTVSPQDGRVYCFWRNSTTFATTMNVLSPSLVIQSTYTIPNMITPIGFRCESSADGSQIGFHYSTSEPAAYFHLISTKTNLSAQRLSYSSGIQMMGGADGSIFTFESPSTHQEVYPLETGGAALRSAVFPAGSEFAIDHRQNRWGFAGLAGQIQVVVTQPDGTQLLQQTFAAGSLRGACFDPVLRKVYVLHGDPTISVTAFNAEL